MQPPILLLLTALASLTCACPQHGGLLSTISSNPSSLLVKRWYSITNPDASIPNVPRPWPIDERTGHQALRVCFYDQNMMNTMVDLFRESVALWQPAMAVSSLTIEPDCGPDQWDCLCTDNGVRWDAVRIIDLTETGIDRGNEASPGYIYRSEEERAAASEPPLYHFMTLIREEERSRASHAYDVFSIAHEIGHALGLLHEHQRPTAASEGVTFVCENLYDAQKVREMIDNQAEGIYEDGDTFERACSEMDIAIRYGFTALSYMPENRDGTALGGLASSETFDWDSIMLYNSYMRLDYRLSDEPPNVVFPQWAILKREIPGSNSYIEVIGGGVTVDEMTRKYDYSQGRISQGDIARIAQLYPNNQDSGREAAEAPGWAPMDD